MVLVKDIQGTRVVYFWKGEDQQRLSPNLPSLVRAEEWRAEYLHSLYDGQDRRTSSIDRRRIAKSLLEVDRHKRHYFTTGRREADAPCEVKEDLATRKLENFRTQYTVIDFGSGKAANA